jgi:hypothetical protein
MVALQDGRLKDVDVRFGSKAEVKTFHFDVCFTLKADIECVLAHVR